MKQTTNRKKKQQALIVDNSRIAAVVGLDLGIGIGGGLTAPPSHTTGHTGPYHGGSDELSVRRYRH